MSTSSERWADGPAILTSIWRYRWLVLATTVLLGTAGFMISQAQDEVYEASSQMFLTDPDSSGVFDQSTRTDLDRYLLQQAEIATSRRVLTATAELLGDGTSPADLAERVEAEGDLDLVTVSVTAAAGSADAAATIANTVVTAYQQTVQETQLERVERATTELTRAAADLQEQIADLEVAAVGAQAGGQVTVLSQRLAEIEGLRQQLEVDARLFGSGVEFVEEAEPPEAAVAPRPRLTAAATGLLGAALASALAYRLAGRQRRITSREDPGRVLDVPLLGVLPTYTPRKRGTLRDRITLEPRTAEAYRFVYSSLEATLRRLGSSSVMITSAGPSTGKTETALQVAATARQRGRDVLLVDADLRMHGLTNFLRAQRAPGLTDLADPAATSPAALVGHYPLRDGGELSVLTSGEVAGDGTDQLSERWFGRVFDQLVEEHDLTIVDSPPLLAVADTATIAGYTDAIVLVIREGSDIDELARVRQRLQFVGQRLVGYVYITPTALDDTAFDYGLVRSQFRSRTGATRSLGGAPAAATSASATSAAPTAPTETPAPTDTPAPPGDPRRPDADLVPDARRADRTPDLVWDATTPRRGDNGSGKDVREQRG